MEYSYHYNENLKDYVDSILFDKNTVISTLQYEDVNFYIDISLEVSGSIDIIYKKKNYTSSKDFPVELIEIIRKNPEKWKENKNIKINSINKFIFSYKGKRGDKDFSKDIDFDGILAKETIDTLREKMLQIVEKEKKEKK